MNIARYLLVLALWITIISEASGDGWELVKDKNSIKIYIRATEDSKFKSHKGEAILRMDIQRLYDVLTDVENYDQWVYECSESRFISKVDHKEYTYYSVIQMPWPFDDRDMVTRIEVKKSHDTIWLATKLVNGVMDEVKGRVRIPAYDEVTTLVDIGEGRVKMIMEGYFEPGGSLPAWLVNMFLAEGPFESLMKIKELHEGNGGSLGDRR